jgi:hypothetical protein
MKRSLFLACVTAAVLGLAAACSTYKVPDDSKVNFVPLDKGVAESVRLVGTETRTTSDGRLEVAARLQNLLNRRIEVQVECVFQNAQGFPTGDSTGFQTLILTENATETVRFTSLNDQAKRFVIRVRQAR